MNNKVNIIENLHYSFNLLRRNKDHNKDSMRGRGRLFTLLKDNQQNGIAQRDLAEKLDVKPSSMSELIQKLEHRGFITKTQDENDKRSFKIFLTQQGSDKIEESKLEKTRFIDTIFKDFSENDIDSLSQLLEKLTSSLKEFSEQEGEQGHDKHHRMEKGEHDHRRRHGKRGHHRHGHAPRHHEHDDKRPDENQ